MDFFNSILNWFRGDQEREQKTRSVQTSNYGSASRGTPAPMPNGGYQPRFTPTQRQWNPQQASQPTQRALRASGWEQPNYQPLQQDFDDRFEEEGRREIRGHSYGLTPWQQERMELNYGIESPDEEVRLRGAETRTGTLTQDAMSSLNEAQMDALRFNNILLPAVEADRALQGPEMDSSERRVYDRRAEGMFGTQGTSMKYAPNTLDALDKLGLSGQLQGQDLDEYLTLDRAYNMDEIAALQPWEGTLPEMPEFTSLGMSQSQDYQAQLDFKQAELAGNLIETALQNPAAVGWDERSRAASVLGLPDNRPTEQVPWGYMPTGQLRAPEQDPEGLTQAENIKEAFYQDWYQWFREKDVTDLELVGFWPETEEKAFTPEDLQEFWTYVYNRSYDPGQEESTPYLRSGEELRQFLGLE